MSTSAPLSAVARRWKDPLERKLAAIWEEVLGQPVGATDDFFDDLGGDSVKTYLLFCRIRERLQIVFPPSVLLESRTVERLAAHLRKGAHRGSTLVAIQPRGEHPPLFFAHGADGSVFYYRRLAEHLASHLPFYGIQAPVAGKAPASLADMVAGYIVDIKMVRPKGPYLLGGYCMGGAVALEMARQLQAAGDRVSLLVLVDTYDWTRCLPGSGFERLVFLGQKLRFHGGNFRLLPARERRVFLREKAWWGRGLVSDWWHRKDEETPAASVVRLLSDEAPGFFPGPAIVFRSRAVYARYRGHDLKAGVHAARIEVEMLPTYPGGILMEPFVSHLADRIKARLADAEA